MDTDVLMVRAILEHAEFLRERIERAAKDAGHTGMTPPQVMALASHQAQCTSAQLARRVGVTRQSMQKTLNQLREAGLVELEPHPTDGRSKQVVLTSVGQQVCTSLERAMDGFGRRFDAAFGTDTMHRVRHVLASDWPEILRTDP